MISYGISHKGYVRKENEDAYYIQKNRLGSLENLFVVADGMGGHKGGAIASKYAVDTIYNFVSEAKGSIKDIISSSIKEANVKIHSHAALDNTLFGMGTTVDVVSITEDMLYVGHVGDSRVYLLYENNIIQITRDHSYVQELVDAGVISETEAFHHPNKNRIMRALGVDRTIQVDNLEVKLPKEPFIILMCSDGLSNMIESEKLKEIVMQNKSIQDRCSDLLDEALEKGGIDNITLILLEREGR